MSITLYFAQAMSSELRASDNRVSGLAAEQAIAGAARYVSYVLASQLTNGLLPDPTTYLSQAVPVGESRFWLIGRDTNNPPAPGQVSFGLVDEASKLNLNTTASNILYFLPRMTSDLNAAILDWRNTNSTGASAMYYSLLQPPYQCKAAPFETVDELRLVHGADMDTLLGEDANRNGVLDPNENDENHNGQLDPGLLEYVTVYSREPNTNSDGVARINIRNVTGTTGPLPSLLESTFGQSRSQQILTRLGLVTTAGGPGGPGGQPSGGPGGGGRGPGPARAITVTFSSPLQLYLRSGMTAEEFGRLANKITVTAGAYIEGRVNVNTASVTVLACLPGLSDSPDLAQTLVSYRLSNPDKLTSVAWVVEALGQNNATVLNALANRDCITTLAYQFTADVAALGPHGRGYRRVRFVFDTCDGTPRMIYRQDLTYLGWALGKTVRQNFLVAKDTSTR